MKFSRSSVLVLSAWIVFVGGYTAVACLFPPSHWKAALEDFIECLVPLFANGSLLWNAASPFRRRNLFWKFLALGCVLRLAGQLVLAYNDLDPQHAPLDSLLANLLFSIGMVSMMAALLTAPQERKVRDLLRYGWFDLIFLAAFWVYVYVFAGAPFQIAWHRPELSLERSLEVLFVQVLLVAVVVATRFFRGTGSWRIIYGHLLGAFAVYELGIAAALRTVWGGSMQRSWTSGLAYVVSFAWLATAGIVASRLSQAPESEPTVRRDTQWPARLAMFTTLALPPLALWDVFGSDAPASVRTFRLVATLSAIFAGGALVFLRHHLIYRERTKVMRELAESLGNANRLQGRYMQSERLASLGQLAAGAAHEINNPLTAILGYTDLLLEENLPPARSRALVEKLHEQARRTKLLVNNLSSFAQQAPAEKRLLDLNAVLDGAIQLRKLDLHGKNIRIEIETDRVLPGVRGDSNQLLQVFYQIISNAVDAMESVGGGDLLIHGHAEKGNVIIEFSNTGPSMRELDKIFEPFYTTKPVGKGTGLGLSICRGIMAEHGGSITGFNRTDGGCTFRLELPAVLTAFPQVSIASLPQRVH